MKRIYDWVYRHNLIPWDLGPRLELVELVENCRLLPCKAIDLGCGTASNAIFLAQHGFDVTGTDYSAGAMEMCRQRGAVAGVNINWIEDDLTNLQHVRDQFDLLVDWGVYDDLKPADRRAYLHQIIPLTHSQSQFLIYVHQWLPRWWERPMNILGMRPMAPGEVQKDFSPWFEIEAIAERRFDGFIGGEAVYLMKRK
jgi:SAM-dependent methyltransferase